MRNNTKGGRRGRRPARVPVQPELQWLEDGVHTILRHATFGLIKSGEVALNVSHWAYARIFSRRR